MSAHAKRAEFTPGLNASETLVRLTHEELAALVEELENSPFLRPTVRHSVMPKCRAALALNPCPEPDAR